MKNKIIQKIEKSKDKLKEWKVKKIGLFGSYLNGKPKKESDVDILVTFDKINPANYFELWIYLEKLLGKKIDLIIEGDLIKRLSYIKKEAEYARL